MVNLSADNKKQLLDILTHLPVLTNEKGREAVFISACLEDLRPHVDLSGPSSVAIPLVINTLISYGRLNYEHEALGRFLNTIKDYVGVDVQEFLDSIITKYQLMTPIAKSTAKIGWVVSVTQEEVLEKIVGENTLRPIAFLQKGINASRSVTYIEISSGSKKWSGTGFMISPNLLITNHHVLPQRNLLAGAIFRFNYQLDLNGNPELFKDYSALPEGIFYYNDKLDYTVVELMNNPGNEWGYLTLKPQVPLPDNRVNIIQHPSGLPKQISIRNNFIKFADSNIIQYVTSTLPGSSGSPVLNDHWEVIGLHHAGGLLPEEESGPLYFRNEGITIKAIINDFPDEVNKQLTHM